MGEKLHHHYNKYYLGKHIEIDFYRCTVHLDNVKIPFHQQMHLLLDIQGGPKVGIQYIAVIPNRGSAVPWGIANTS